MKTKSSFHVYIKSKLTEKLICQVGIELLREKKISEISVNDLCSRAGINRSTFYRHFSDIYDMKASIEDDCLSELTNEVISGGEIDGNILLRDLMEKMRNSSLFSSRALENLDISRIAAMAVDYYETPIKSQWRRVNNKITEREIECTFDALIGCLTRIIDLWVKSGMPENTNEIISVLHYLSFYGLF